MPLLSSAGSFRSADHLGQVVAPVKPLAAGTSVFISTGLGAVAALDAADGAILWIREYPRLNSSAQAESVRTRNRWDPNLLFEREGQVLAAPQDSNLLFGLQAEDGTIAWQVPRDFHATLLGADDAFCYLGGTTLSASTCAPRRTIASGRSSPSVSGPATRMSPTRIAW